VPSSYFVHAASGNLFVDLLLMVEVVADRVVNLGGLEVREGVEDLVHGVASLPHDGDLQYGDACSGDARRTPTNLGIPNDVRMLCLDVHSQCLIVDLEVRQSSPASFPIALRDRLPAITIPLRRDDPPVRLDLQALLAHAYSSGRYHRRLDYSQPCDPPLEGEDATWAGDLLQGQGMR
jgi:hypothetical protein